MMAVATHGVHDNDQIVTSPHHGGPMADEHTFALTVEASGEVTPHQPDNATETEPEEAEQ